ncbi:peptidylprolyl isomerase [Granulicella cerasi]|uniref:Peptidyl-prolyl cis-trans isomerase n=1 Tax=Granulicella cerasi TaxID=741063 RepID=A0ABW1ZEX0_9BACT|nr:peptidylprolyl isomerase [Granulicella cerasi]
MIRRVIFQLSLASAFAVGGVAAAQTQLPDAPSATVHELPPAVPNGPMVVFDTTMGRLTCQFFQKETPVTVENFIGLATGRKDWTDPVTGKKVSGKPFYDGVTFHRVIPGFMIQGGDRLGTGAGDAGFFIDNEVVPSLRFDRPGRLAMANAGPNTNGTQFFITEAAHPELNGSYTIFGQCDDHTVMLAATIARVERNAEDKPTTPVIINKVYIVPEGQTPPPVQPGPQNIIPEGATPQTHPPAQAHP